MAPQAASIRSGGERGQMGGFRARPPSPHHCGCSPRTCFRNSASMQYYFHKRALNEFKRRVKNTEPHLPPSPHFIDDETEVQRQTEVCPWSSSSFDRGRTRRQVFRALFQKFCRTLALLPRHTMGVLWNLPSLGPCFPIRATSGRTKQGLWHVPLPHSSERPFVPSSWTFHRPVLDQFICQRVTILAFISELRYFGLSAFKCTLCFFGS